MNRFVLSRSYSTALSRELTFWMSMVSSASFLKRSFLSLLDSELLATPPPPVFEPTLCWKSIDQGTDPLTPQRPKL